MVYATNQKQWHETFLLATLLVDLRDKNITHEYWLQRASAFAGDQRDHNHLSDITTGPFLHVFTKTLESLPHLDAFSPWEILRIHDLYELAGFDRPVPEVLRQEHDKALAEVCEDESSQISHW